MAFWLRTTFGWGLALAQLALAATDRAAVAADPVAPGFRRLDGRHLTLITDLPASVDVDELPQVFDAAFPQWCEYFALDAQQHADWHATGYLMQSKERFQQAGYWRADLPPFPNGYSTGKEFWLHNQTSPYYRRHLLLHEGVHSFMYQLIGTVGPSWYIEGIAELLATHRWHDGQLTVNYFPASAAEVPGLARIELVQGDVKQHKCLSLADVLAYDNRAHQQVQAYAWSWALAALLDGSDHYRARFRQSSAAVREGKFAVRFRQLFDDDWSRLDDDWQALIANLEYGYDFSRMASEFADGQPLPAAGTKATVAADRGWQSSGVHVEAGQRYRLAASGRYQIGQKPSTWWCEPAGVTIRYHHGQPLGMLLAAIRPDGPQPNVGCGSEAGCWAQPIAVGLAAVLAPQRSGTLYLRINEPASELADNAGTLSVAIDEVAPGGEARPAKGQAKPKRGARDAQPR
jgi:hypothetical protein